MVHPKAPLKPPQGRELHEVLVVEGLVVVSLYAGLAGVPCYPRLADVLEDEVVPCSWRRIEGDYAPSSVVRPHAVVGIHASHHSEPAVEVLPRAWAERASSLSVLIADEEGLVEENVEATNVTIQVSGLGRVGLFFNDGIPTRVANMTAGQYARIVTDGDRFLLAGSSTSVPLRAISRTEYDALVRDETIDENTIYFVRRPS